MEIFLQRAQNFNTALSGMEVLFLLAGLLLFGFIGFSIGALVFKRKVAQKEGARLRRQNLSLLQLATSTEVRNGDLQASFRKIVKESACELETSLSSIWIIDKSNRRIKCVARFDRDLDEYVDEFEVKLDDYPKFYASIQRKRMHTINNILKTEFAEEFTHLLNNGIRAVLSTPIRVDGELVAFLCHCNRSTSRKWTADEQAFAASVADIVSMSFHSSQKQEYSEEIKTLIHVIESSVDGMAILDAEGRFIFMNDVHAHIYGYGSGKELLGETWEVLYEADEIEIIKRDYFPKLHVGLSIRIELDGKKKDGTSFPCEAILTGLEDGGLVCVCRDITDRRKAEDEIQQLAEYSTLNPSPVFRFNKEGKITHSNPAAEELQILANQHGPNLLELMPTLTEADLFNCIDMGETISRTSYIGDQCFLIVLQGFSEQNSGYAYATNITSRKATEADLKKSRKFLRTVIDLDPNFIFVKDREGRFTLVNKAVADAYGTTPENLIGRKDSDFNKQPDEVDHFRLDDLRVIDNQEELFIPEEVITDAQGNIRKLQTVKKPLKLSPDEDCKVLGVSTDITKLTELQSQLLHAQKMEAVGQLAGGIAHDFNNLLTGILGYATLVKTSDLSTYDRERIGTKLETAAERASELTQKLLGFARKGKNRNIPINLHSVIDETISMIERVFEENIIIKQDLSSELAIINGDPTQIQQVVLNLAINARDSMSESLGGSKGGELLISTETIETPNRGAQVKLSFSDTGCGIPEDVQRKIFEPFFTTKPLKRGTGMGLAMVYGIVENHGGEVSFHSKIGEGTTFNLLFPATELLEEEHIVSDKKEVIKGEGKILVVDDNEIVLNATADMLKVLGYQVEIALNGWQAIKLFKNIKDDIDLVILDMVMPELDAEETFTHLIKIDPNVKSYAFYRL